MKRRGFTLIELLVVIAIIAILAAILFPVFAQAREKARQTSCLSNEKQIGLGLLQYQQDYDETFPMNEYFSSASPDTYWYQAIGPYVKSGNVTAATGYYNGYGGVWSCPDEPVQQPETYGISRELAPNGEGVNGDNTGTVAIHTVTNSLIQTPSDTVAVCEKGMNDGNRGWSYFTTAQQDWTNTSATSAAYPNYCLYLNGASAANNWTYPASQHSDVSGRGNDTGGDCDTPGAEGYTGTTNPTFSATSAYGCGTMPRYRHAGNTVSNFLFCDGHAKAEHKGQVNWYINIYIPTAYDENENNGYPYC